MTTGFFTGREALRHVGVAIGAVGRPGEDDQKTRVIDVSEIGAFLGLDVGKGEHHATAVTPAGKKAFDKRLPNSEPKLREVLGLSWSTSPHRSVPCRWRWPGTWAARSPICRA